MTERTVLTGGRALRPDGSLDRADLLIEDGAIATISADLQSADAERLDATGKLIFPGFVNAHMHSGENFNPGLYENLPLDVWFVRSHQVTRHEPPSREAIYVRTLLGASLMLRSGTTAAVDFLYEAPAITIETLEPVVQAYKDAGLRATILLGVADLPFAQSLPLEGTTDAAAAREAPPPSYESIMELAREAVERWHEPGGLIGIGLGPSAPQRCSPELLEASLKFCSENGLAWQTHVLETKIQAITSRDWLGETFVEQMARRGLLGPSSTLVHTVWLSDHDIELMAQSGLTAVHCLLSNLRLGDGVARLPSLRRAGVQLALGTDGRGCDETLDLFELTKMTALIHKARGGDYRDWPRAAEAHAMATAGGSSVAGHGDRLGRIEHGAAADLVLIRDDALAFTPMIDPVRQLVYGAPSRDVDTVIVNGRTVVRGGDVLGIDAAWLAERVPVHAHEALTGTVTPEAQELERMVSEMYLRMDSRELELDAYLNG
ncbi:MAG TPA: amidohydrolase family protein [Solirubrobacteraceae bacterium]